MTHQPPISRSERGSVLVIVAIFSVVIFVMAAATIDVGNLRQDRRALTTATDASALAAVQDVDFGPSLAMGNTPCSAATAKSNPLDSVFDVADDYLTSNVPGSNLTGCTIVKTAAGAGYVSVTANHKVDYAFAPVVGIEDATARSESAASIVPSVSTGGLRPFGLCSLSTPFQAWLTGGRVPGQAVYVPIRKLTGGGCGTVPGNWGQMDFNEGSNPSGELIDWTENGWVGPPNFEVSAPPNPCTVTGPIRECIEGDTGGNYSPLDSNNPANSALFKIKDKAFWLPTFQFVAGPGNNALFEVNGFVEVILRDYCVRTNGTGLCDKTEKDLGGTKDTKADYFKIEIYQWSTSGPCCAAPVTPQTPGAPRICAVDSNTSSC